MKYLKHILIVSLLISLVGCTNEVEESESLLSESSTVEQQLNHEEIEAELTYIETLVGVEELSAAKLALETLESQLIKLDIDEELSERLTELKETLSQVDVSGDDCHDHSFTGVDAVSIAIERYGADDDIVYMYDENHEHYADDQIGYYVALKSKSLQEQEGGDGIILLLFIGEDGSISEL